MALMERVATLLRANLNELMDRAEDPATMLKQLVVDMENQLLQVKTQVALALAHQHLLEKKAAEQEHTANEWHRKAELAVTKGDDALARAALERALSQEDIVKAFRTQLADGTSEADALRLTYSRLQGKLAETRAQCEVMLAQHQRAHLVARATEARAAERSATGSVSLGAIHRVRARIDQAEAEDLAHETLLPTESLEAKFAKLELDDRVEQLLADLKSKGKHLLPTG